MVQMIETFFQSSFFYNESLHLFIIRLINFDREYGKTFTTPN
jgi:hypothetical protein